LFQKLLSQSQFKKRLKRQKNKRNSIKPREPEIRGEMNFVLPASL
jgi:hypothetical protein